MTREERIDWLCRLRSNLVVYMPQEWVEKMERALSEVIDRETMTEQKMPTIADIVLDGKEPLVGIERVAEMLIAERQAVIDRVLEIIDEEQEGQLKRSNPFQALAAHDALECLADRIKGLKGNKEE